MKHIFLLLAGLLLANRIHAENAQPAPAPAADPLAALASYDFGGDRTPLALLDEQIAIARTQTALRASILLRLRGVLSDPAARPGALEYACRTLSTLGDTESVFAIGGLLAHENAAVFDYARLALERIPGGDVPLRTALASAAPARRAGLILSLGRTGGDGTVEAVGRFLRDDDVAIGSAAARALGLTGTRDAAALLIRNGDVRRPEVADALMLCADRLAGSDPRRAAGWYEEVLDSASSPASLEAALIGLASAQPAATGKRLLKMLESEDPVVVSRALRVARGAQVPGFLESAVDRIDRLSADSQLALLGLLIDQRHASAMPVALALMESDHASVVAAAIAAIAAGEGSAEAVGVLLDRAVKDRADERKALAAALAQVRGAGVDEAVRAGLSEGPVLRRVAAIRAMGERKAEGASALLMALRGDDSVAVRRAALQSLEGLVKGSDHAVVLDWMLNARDPAEARDAERLALRAGTQSPNAVDELLAADAVADDREREALARALARRGGPAALGRVESYLKSGRDELERAALRALSGWVDAAPVDLLRGVATNASDARKVGVAVHGLVSLLAMDTQRTAALKADVLIPLLPSSSGDVRTLLISALSEYPSDATTAALTALEQDPACGAEVKAALRRLRYRALGAPIVTASHGGGSASAAVDGNPSTRWTTGEGMRPGQWLELDLKANCRIRRIVLDAKGSDGDYPRAFEVYAGATPAPSGAPVLKGEGAGPVMELTFEPEATGRYVRILQKGRTSNLYWSVHELRVEAELAD